MHPDSPDAELTQEDRREYFLKNLAISLDRFNMDSLGSPATDAAVAEYKRVQEEKVATHHGKMHPYVDSIVWLDAERHGRYLMFPCSDTSAVHLCFAFCPKIGEYTLNNRPPVVETFRLKVSLGSGGYKYWDSRPKGSKFSQMRDERTEFITVISKLMFGGDRDKATDYTSAIEYRLELFRQ